MGAVSVVPGSFSFDAGRLCLDFLATLSNRGSWAATERLRDAESLAAWVEAAGLGPVASEVRGVDLSTARELREAVFGVVDAAMRGAPPAAADVDLVNRAAEPAPAVAHLAVEAGLVVGRRRALTAPEALSAVARDAIDLVAGAEIARLRFCEADDCTGLYIDASRGRRRRWCSTARCGNRARVAAHRTRARSSPADG